ncbi:MAG: hypothetical protein WCY46_01065 [Tissierellaceae bacterium]
MLGLLLYNKEDYLRNETYVKWLIEEGYRNDLNLMIMIKNDLILKGIPKTSI